MENKGDKKALFSEKDRENGVNQVQRTPPPAVAKGAPNERIDVLERSLNDARKLLKLIFNLSTNFIYLPSEDIDDGVNDILGIIGQYAGADRSYVFQANGGTGDVMYNTHEWCAPGIESQREKLQGITYKDMPWFLKKMSNLEIIHVPDVSGLPVEAAREREEFEREGIRSLIVVPMARSFSLVGFLGFDSVNTRRTWSDDTIMLLRMIGEFFANAFVQKKAEAQLKESATKYRVLFEYANDAIFIIRNGKFMDCNSRTLKMFKCAREEIIGRSPHEFSPQYQPDGTSSRERVIEKAKAAVEGRPQYFEWRHQACDGTFFDAEVSLNGIEIGGEALLQAIIRDVTARKRWEQALRESEERYHSLFGETRDAIYIVKKDGSFVDVNESFLDLFGFTREELSGLNVKIAYLNDEERNSFKEMIRTSECLKDHQIRLKKRDGSQMDCLVTVTTKKDKNGGIIGYHGIIRDVTRVKKAEETIRHMAYHDTLTGLPNRALFNDRLTMAASGALRSGKSVAVMMLDLDKFKEVNDVLGHDIGDLLLKAVAERLENTFRKSDTVARMGGDEFMVILPELSEPEDVSIVAQKVVSAFQDRFELEGHKLSVTTSVGVSMYPQDGHDTETLLKNADIAMYHAKMSGRNKFAVYAPHMRKTVPE